MSVMRFLKLVNKTITYMLFLKLVIKLNNLIIIDTVQFNNYSFNLKRFGFNFETKYTKDCNFSTDLYHMNYKLYN